LTQALKLPKPRKPPDMQAWTEVSMQEDLSSLAEEDLLACWNIL